MTFGVNFNHIRYPSPGFNKKRFDPCWSADGPLAAICMLVQRPIALNVNTTVGRQVFLVKLICGTICFCGDIPFVPALADQVILDYLGSIQRYRDWIGFFLVRVTSNDNLSLGQSCNEILEIVA